MTVLIIAEHNVAEIAHSTRSTITAAEKLGAGDVHLLVTGNKAVAENAAKFSGVAKVIYSDAPYYAHGLAENITPLVVKIVGSYSHILAPASTFGKDVLPRIAAVLGIPQISDIIKIESASMFVRPFYAGNALAKVEIAAGQQVAITVRPTAFDAANQGGSAAIEAIAPEAENTAVSFVGMEATKSDRPDLGSAKIVVSGGRAFGSAEKFKMIEQLADRLGAAVGASRAAVDAGYAPNDYQVGQTGKIVAPSLYIAIGISGAIQHLAGMKDSKVIVAINKDPNAPIFEIADYGLTGDLFEILPELEKCLG